MLKQYAILEIYKRTYRLCAVMRLFTVSIGMSTWIGHHIQSTPLNWDTSVPGILSRLSGVPN